VPDWSSEEIRKRVERMVIDDEGEESEDLESKFMASAAIQALVAMTDPVGHSSVRDRDEAAQKRWTFSRTYFFFAADFYGKHVSSAVDVQEVFVKNPRSFSLKLKDTENVSIIRLFEGVKFS